MFKVSIFYRTGATGLPLNERFNCTRFEREGEWIEFETEDGELIIISPASIIRINIAKCQTE